MVNELSGWVKRMSPDRGHCCHDEQLSLVKRLEMRGVTPNFRFLFIEALG